MASPVIQQGCNEQQGYSAIADFVDFDWVETTLRLIIK